MTPPARKGRSRLPAALLRLWILALLLMALLLGGPSPAQAGGGSGGGGGDGSVVEYLRLKVPAAAREAWLQAERETWEPWLAQQPGFEGRQLLWDPARQEGVLLIRWASRDQWQAIDAELVDRVQTRFEARARAGSGNPPANPFPLVFSGELEPL